MACTLVMIPLILRKHPFKTTGKNQIVHGIISKNDYNEKFPDIVVCVITSNIFKDDFSVILNDADLETGILPEKSVIKCHKLFTIEQSQIIKKFSTINAKKFEEVRTIVNNLFQVSR